VVSTWSNVIAAHLIATVGAADAGLLALQIGITTAVYWAGMILNDCFDLEEDRRERPERPLPSGRISLPAAWAAGGALLALALLLALAAGERILSATAALAATVLLYDGLLKGGALGPLAMGLCRYLNWIMGLSVVPVLGTPLMLLPLPMLLYTMGVTYLSRAETGTEIRAGVIRAAAALAAVALAVLTLYPAGVQTQPFALAVLLALMVHLARALWRVGAEPSADRVRQGVRAMLLGMIVLDAALLAGDGQWVAAAALLPLALAGRLLARGVSPT
jgi:4-hydroxybenzoate polyprenyltransferase